MLGLYSYFAPIFKALFAGSKESFLYRSMHFLSVQTVTLCLASLAALTSASAFGDYLNDEPAVFDRYAERSDDHGSVLERDLSAILSTHAILEACHDPYRVLRRNALPEPYLQLSFLGGALRGAGKGLSKVPEKAGKKVAKEQGKNSKKNQGDDEKAKKTVDTMMANLKKEGKSPDRKCLTNMVNTFTVFGGVNGNYKSCWEKKPKEQQKQDDAIANARKTIAKNEGKAKKLLGWG